MSAEHDQPSTATAEQRPGQGFGPHIGGGGLVTISLSALPGSEQSLWEAVVSDYKLTEQGQDTEAVRTALDDAGVKWLETEGVLGTKGVLAQIPSDNFILRWFGAGDWVRIIKTPHLSDLKGPERAVQKVAAILIGAGLVVKGEHY